MPIDSDDIKFSGPAYPLSEHDGSLPIVMVPAGVLDDLTTDEVVDTYGNLDTAIVDSFALVVEYAQERTASAPPTFSSYDVARDVGIALLTDHADALSFKIEKRTSLQK